MFFLWPRKKKSLRDNFQCALEWIDNNTIRGEGISVTSKNHISYPEVTGYYIPTLMNWGMQEKAEKYAKWLISVQNTDGSWNAPASKSAYVFDSGQALKGLTYLIKSGQQEWVAAVIKGSDWICNQADNEGRMVTPSIEEWSLPGGRVVPEAVHLYVLEPLKYLGEKFKEDKYLIQVEKSLKYYLREKTVADFNTLSHFHAYIIESLVDLKYDFQAKMAMQKMASLQFDNGAIPAYNGDKWVCSTGLFQYALIWYKLGNVGLANKAFSYACSLQNKSGGFFGSYGTGATYFPREEISWAVKYFLDALWWKIKVDKEFDSTYFRSFINRNDGTSK